MNIIVTGSLGNVSGPLTEMLVRDEHHLTVVSSDPEKAAQINHLGASTLTGSLSDGDFVQHTFVGADALYAMIPFSFTALDQRAYLHEIATNYVRAVQQTGIKRVVVLSGWAADLVPSASVEDVFAQLTEVAVTFLRPAYFYSNFYLSLEAIRQTGQLTAMYGGEDRVVFVSPKDIAADAAEELVASTPSQIRYVGSEEMTYNEATRIMGTAIGKSALQWMVISEEQMLAEYQKAGLPATLAQNLVDMQATMHDGTALANFQQAKPTLGTVKLAEFAQEFAIAYQSN
jgi:NAD(P)H dehydrogenase (quinone)